MCTMQTWFSTRWLSPHNNSTKKRGGCYFPRIGEPVSRQGFEMESFVIDRSLSDDSGESVDILSSSALSLHGLALGILASSTMTLLAGNWWALYAYKEKFKTRRLRLREVKLRPEVKTSVKTVLLYSSDWPGTCCVDQVSLELTDVCLLLPPECWHGSPQPV